MTQTTWGVGGTTRSTNTSGAGDGWRTPGIGTPTCRAIYDGTRPVQIFSVVPAAGTGDRLGRFRLQGDGSDRASGYFGSSGFAIEFRVIRNSGNIQLGLLGNGQGPTYWISSGDPVNWSPNGIQPGTLTYFQAPSAPTNVVITPGTGQISVAFANPTDNGGLALTQFRHQVSLRSDFATIVKEVTDTNTPTVITGLPSNVVLYHRMMAENAVTAALSKKGGAATATKSFTLGTPPATAPTLGVASSSDGSYASIILTPPTTGGPFLDYTLTTTPVDAAGNATGAPTTNTFTTIIYNKTGLIPGQRYKYTATARSASGNSPASTPVFVTQTRPTLEPGDYFDGAKVALTDDAFNWTGTAGSSTSQAKGFSTTGWRAFPTSGDAHGATGVCYSMTGGFNRSRSVRCQFFSDATSAGVVFGTAEDPANELVDYSAMVGARTTGRSQQLAMAIRFTDASHAQLATVVGQNVLVPAGAFTLLPSVYALSPAGTAFVSVLVIDVNDGTNWALWRGGDLLRLDSAIFSVGQLDGYFDGAYVDNNQWNYAWTGTADASTSTRTPVIAAPTDPLADPDCPAPPDPPRAPIIDDLCIDETGTWRRYWATIPATDIPEFTSTLPTLILSTAGDEARQARIRIYPNPDALDPDDIDDASYDSELIVSYMPPNTDMTLDSPMQRAYASVAGSATIPADHLLYGTGGTPPVWPELGCGQAYIVSFDVPVTAPIGNFSTRVLLTRKII
jgi:hypothetical protein